MVVRRRAAGPVRRLIEGAFTELLIVALWARIDAVRIDGADAFRRAGAILKRELERVLRSR